MNRIFEILDCSKELREPDPSDTLQSVLHIDPIKPREILPELEISQQLNLDLSEIDLTFSEAPQNFKIKKQRGNKKDNFNYELHIKKELQKMDLSNMTKKEKKIAIQKIRNWMSAQRSRLRQKKIFHGIIRQKDLMRKENEFLTMELLRQREQNRNLLNQLQSFSSQKLSISTESEDSIQLYWTEKQQTQQNILSQKLFLFLIGVFFLFGIFSQDDTRSAMTKICGFQGKIFSQSPSFRYSSLLWVRSQQDFPHQQKVESSVLSESLLGFEAVQEPKLDLSKIIQLAKLKRDRKLQLQKSQ